MSRLSNTETSRISSANRKQTISDSSETSSSSDVGTDKSRIPVPPESSRVSSARRRRVNDKLTSIFFISFCVSSSLNFLYNVFFSNMKYYKGLFNNYVMRSCLNAKFRWLISHVQLSFQPLPGRSASNLEAWGNYRVIKVISLFYGSIKFDQSS